MKASKFTLSAVALVLLSASGWASDKMKANIQIYEPVHVGSTQLAAGEYKMSWTETGTSAEVTFSQGKKVIATVPAQVTQVSSGYSGPAIETDSSSLTRIALPKTSFTFTTGNTITGN